MSSELTIYKKNRINELQNAFNTNLARLNYYLATNISNIKKTRLTVKVKHTQINNLISTYNNNVNYLRQILNKNMRVIQNYSPKPIIINKKKNALLIGINYTGTQNELYGCINDVNSIKERLTQNGFNNIDVMTDLTNIKATKANILNFFKNLLINSHEGDLLFLLYSGHGSYDLDRNKDETTGYDQLIIPCDFNIILDDELKHIIQTYLKKNVTLFAMFDSCFSGSVLDLRYQYMDSINYDNFTENIKQTETSGDVLMISGCSDYQTSADAVINNKASGAMTWSLLEALKQKPKCTWRELLKNMRNLLKSSKYDQIPQFSSGTFENIDTEVFI
jgi:hypothetical protein